MRVLFTAAMLLVCSQCAFAQEAASSPAQTSPGAALPGDEISLIPPLPPPPPAAERDARQKLARSTTAKTVDLMKQQIRMRQLKTILSRNPVIVEAQERAATARTDPEKRVALRNYYTLLFARMEKMEGSLAAPIAERRKRVFNLLDQKRLGVADPETELSETSE